MGSLKEPLLISQMYAEVSATFDCRICGCGQIEKDNLLIQPCNCMGGLSLVHAQCLQKWIQLRPNSASESGGAMKCEICRSEYNISIQRKFDVSQVCKCKPVGYFFEAVFLLLVLSATTLLMIQVSGSIESKGSPRSNPSEKVTLWSLFGITFIMAVLALEKLTRKFILAASTSEIKCHNPPPFGGSVNPISSSRLSVTLEGEGGGSRDNSGSLIIGGGEDERVKDLSTTSEIINIV